MRVCCTLQFGESWRAPSSHLTPHIWQDAKAGQESSHQEGLPAVKGKKVALLLLLEFTRLPQPPGTQRKGRRGKYIYWSIQQRLIPHLGWQDLPAVPPSPALQQARVPQHTAMVLQAKECTFPLELHHCTPLQAETSERGAGEQWNNQNSPSKDKIHSLVTHELCKALRKYSKGTQRIKPVLPTPNSAFTDTRCPMGL